MSLFSIILEDENGQTLIEYSLILTLMVIVILASLLLVRADLILIYNEQIVNKLPK